MQAPVTPPVVHEVKQNGDGHCANGPAGPSSQSRIAIRPKDATAPVVVITGGPWTQQGHVTPEKNAWIAHIIGSPHLTADTVTLTVNGETFQVPVVIDNRAQCGDTPPPTEPPPTTTTTVPPVTPPTTVPPVTPPTVPPTVPPKVPVALIPPVTIVRAPAAPPVPPPVPVVHHDPLPFTGSQAAKDAAYGAAAFIAGCLLVVASWRRPRRPTVSSHTWTS